jgi:hypothetical protein
MKKPLSLAFAAALAFGVGSTTFAASANFVDVPAKHWSYDAVSYLAGAGIIEGYSDKTFQGDKTISRYEMAEIVYKAMQNQSKANIAQKALIDKLGAEYALEMNKIDKLDTRLTKVEQNQSGIKFSGSLLVQQKWKSMDNVQTKKGSNTEQSWFRMNGTAKVDENTSIGMRLVNIAPTKDNFRAANAIAAGTYGSSSSNTYGAEVDRFFATTKLGAVKATLGRQALELDKEDILVDSAFFSYDGAKLAWNWNGLNFDVKHGRFTRDVVSYDFDNLKVANYSDGKNAAAFSNVDVDSINIASKTGKLSWNVGAASFRNWKINQDLTKYYYTYAGWQFNDKFSMAAEYGKNQEATEGGAFGTVKAVYGAQSLSKKGNQNFTVQYWQNQKNAFYTAYTSIDTIDEGLSNATKTLDFSYRYAISKNMTAKLQHATITDKTDNKNSYSFWKTQFIYKF